MLRGPPPASPSVPTALDSKWSFGLHSERQSSRPVRIVQTLRTLDELLFLVVSGRVGPSTTEPLYTARTAPGGNRKSCRRAKHYTVEAKSIRAAGSVEETTLDDIRDVTVNCTRKSHSSPLTYDVVTIDKSDPYGLSSIPTTLTES